MEEVKTKVCPKCGEEKPLTKEFWYQYTKNKGRYVYWHSYCKKCCEEQAKQFYLSDMGKQVKRRHHKNAVNVLGDAYVKTYIIRKNNIQREDITPEMIAIKRQQIILHRLLKQFTKEGLSDEFSSSEVNGNQRDVGEVQEKRGYSGGGTGVCLTC